MQLLFRFIVLVYLFLFTFQFNVHEVRCGIEDIKHIVVLMLENRSFDHMLGYLKKTNPNIDGLNGNETNPYDPSDPSKGFVKVTPNSGYKTDPDPDHSLPATTHQIFGFSKETTNATMNGFILSYKTDAGAPNNGAGIMEMFSKETVPAISTLAEEFLIFDHWYSGVPGPTQPNRMFFHSGTSWGATEDNKELLALGYPQKTIFDSLWDAGYTWRDYWSDFPSILFLSNLRDVKYVDNYYLIEEFKDDCKKGDLPTYSFVEPRWFGFLDYEASDEHPPHLVYEGEYLIADVYEALRASPVWNNTLLIITYDEHGGIYDHVPTPLNNIPPPDNHRPPSGSPPFNFDRLGVRVPAVFVSPWLNKGSVVHEPIGQGDTHYCHSSFPGTLKEMFNLSSFLTKRDNWAAKFQHIFDDRKTPRTDCPTTIPRPGSVEQILHWKKYGTSKVTKEAVVEGLLKQKYSKEPITDLQRGFIAIASGLDEPNSLQSLASLAEAASIQTEHHGSVFVQKQAANFFDRQRAKHNQQNNIISYQ